MDLLAFAIGTGDYAAATGSTGDEDGGDEFVEVVSRVRVRKAAQVTSTTARGGASKNGKKIKEIEPEDGDDDEAAVQARKKEQKRQRRLSRRDKLDKWLDEQDKALATGGAGGAGHPMQNDEDEKKKHHHYPHAGKQSTMQRAKAVDSFLDSATSGGGGCLADADNERNHPLTGKEKAKHEKNKKKQQQLQMQQLSKKAQQRLLKKKRQDQAQQHRGEDEDENMEPTAEEDARDDGGDGGAQRGAAVELEGVMEGDDLYLVDKRRSVVFSTNRDESGNLVRVGVWTGKIVFDGGNRKGHQQQHQNKSKHIIEQDNDDEIEPPLAPRTQQDDDEEVTAGLAIPEAYPYHVEADDHCETSKAAYEDIAPFLQRVAKTLKKTPATLEIYDPFYCAGSVVRHLGALGFERVYNKCEDFYAVMNEKRIPNFDVLVTNPPYSGYHIERIVRFAAKMQKPFFLLLPNFVYMKEWYEKVTRKTKKLFYLSPNSRYHYITPRGLRAQAAAADKTSPFMSFWYAWLGSETDNIIGWWKKMFEWRGSVTLSKSSWVLPKNVLADGDPRRKRMRKNQRDARKRKLTTG